MLIPELHIAVTSIQRWMNYPIQFFFKTRESIASEYTKQDFRNSVEKVELKLELEVENLTHLTCLVAFDKRNGSELVFIRTVNFLSLGEKEKPPPFDELNLLNHNFFHRDQKKLCPKI